MGDGTAQRVLERPLTVGTILSQQRPKGSIFIKLMPRLKPSGEFDTENGLVVRDPGTKSEKTANSVAGERSKDAMVADLRVSRKYWCAKSSHIAKKRCFF